MEKQHDDIAQSLKQLCFSSKWNSILANSRYVKISLANNWIVSCTYLPLNSPLSFWHIQINIYFGGLKRWKKFMESYIEIYSIKNIFFFNVIHVNISVCDRLIKGRLRCFFFSITKIFFLCIKKKSNTNNYKY